MHNMVDYLDLMNRFRRAYVKAEAELLDDVLAPGFVWHTHTFPADSPVSTGRVINGIDEMVVELQWRKENWTDVSFDGLQERFAPGLVTQTFTISGLDRGTPFNVAAVDLYDVTDDERIAKKDTYWKQVESS